MFVCVSSNHADAVDQILFLECNQEDGIKQGIWLHSFSWKCAHPVCWGYDALSCFVKFSQICVMVVRFLALSCCWAFDEDSQKINRSVCIPFHHVNYVMIYICYCITRLLPIVVNHHYPLGGFLSKGQWTYDPTISCDWRAGTFCLNFFPGDLLNHFFAIFTTPQMINGRPLTQILPSHTMCIQYVTMTVYSCY